MTVATDLLLEATGIAKTYGAVVALRDASLAVRPGEVHALMGANGAGKSTLVKILTAAVQPDRGTITIRGKPWVTVVENGLLWLEEYPWVPYDHTFNGHNFAMYGLYDYWRQTGSRDAAEMTRGAITTSARVAGRVRTPGGISQYCIAQSCLDQSVPLVTRDRDFHHFAKSAGLPPL